MPAGASWLEYVTFSVMAMLSMAAGSQTVHVLYNPLKDFHKYVESELENRPKVDEIEKE